MKLTISKLLVVTLLGIATISINSCGSQTSENAEITEASYACPMDCEDGKTYTEEGECPVCGMQLKEKK